MCPPRGSFTCLVRRVGDVNPVVSDLRQLHHQAAVQTRLCWLVFLGPRHLCSLLFISPDAWRIDVFFCTNHLHVLQRIFNKLRVSFQSHPFILRVDPDRSIQDLYLLRVFREEPNVPVLFRLKPFLHVVS